MRGKLISLKGLNTSFKDTIPQYCCSGISYFFDAVPQYRDQSNLWKEEFIFWHTVTRRRVHNAGTFVTVSGQSRKLRPIHTQEAESEGEVGKAIDSHTLLQGHTFSHKESCPQGSTTMPKSTTKDGKTKTPADQKYIGVTAACLTSCV